METPADPILASAIYSASNTREETDKPNPLSTSCHAIDTALGNLAEYGSINCISSETNQGRQEICQSLLVSHLLAFPGAATATVIDTGHSFDVRKIYAMLTRELNGESQRAMQVLDRMKIMKVFDFEGLSESIAELRNTLDQETSYPDNGGDSGPRGTIQDSEDEDEMLESPPPPPPPVDPSTPASPSTFLLIDSLSQVAAPTIKSHYAHGQALLTSFMRSLSHLTRSFNLCTLVVNGTTTSTSPHFRGSETASIFSSCSLQPMLGQAFAHLVDEHFLIHQMGQEGTREDHGANGKDGSSLRQSRIREPVYVVEALQTRKGAKAGRWAAFTIDVNGYLKDFAS